MITHTLAFMVEGDRILLGQHQRGLAVGKWNGFGGKIEAGESIEAAMIRETREECGLVPTEFKEMAELHFKMPIDNQIVDWTARVYVVTAWTGQLRPSEEMIPQWFSQPEIPLDQMWEDDYLWLPHVLHGDKLFCKFRFDAGGKVLDHKISKWEG